MFLEVHEGIVRRSLLLLSRETNRSARRLVAIDSTCVWNNFCFSRLKKPFLCSLGSESNKTSKIGRTLSMYVIVTAELVLGVSTPIFFSLALCKTKPLLLLQSLLYYVGDRIHPCSLRKNFTNSSRRSVVFCGRNQIKDGGEANAERFMCKPNKTRAMTSVSKLPFQ